MKDLENLCYTCETQPQDSLKPRCNIFPLIQSLRVSWTVLSIRDHAGIGIALRMRDEDKLLNCVVANRRLFAVGLDDSVHVSNGRQDRRCLFMHQQ